MLDESYFNGDREKLFDSLEQELFSILSLTKKESGPVKMNDIDLPDHIMSAVEKVCGKDYLLPFSSKARLIMTEPKMAVTYEYPGNFGRDPEHLEIERRVVKLNWDVACAVTSCVLGMASAEGDPSSLDFTSGIYPNDGFVPPSPMYKKGLGQEKICVDAILAIDDMLLKDPKEVYNILVIGSGSPGGVRSGVAYSMIPYMCNANVYMFDPFEVARSYTIQTEKFKCEYKVYAHEFLYDLLVDGKYRGKLMDLCLDDSWVKGVNRNERDLDDRVSRCPHFSIKQFFWERGRFGNVYTQRYHTEGLEERRVSRDPRCVATVDHPGLGRCVGCRELRLRLKRRYSDNFYRAFLSCHQVNCEDAGRRPLDVVVDFDGWIRVEPFLVNYDNYCSLNCDYFLGSKMVGVSFQGANDVRMVYSSKDFVLYRFLRDAYQNLVITADGKFFVDKLRGEIPYKRKEIEVKSGTINLAHSKGVKEIKDKLKNSGSSNDANDDGKKESVVESKNKSKRKQIRVQGRGKGSTPRFKKKV